MLLLLAPGTPSAAGGLDAEAPAQARARYTAGVNYYRQGRYEDAAREFAVARRIYPKSAKLAYNLGRSLERARAYEAAVAAYRDFLKLRPEAEDRSQVEATIATLGELLAGHKGELVVNTSPEGAQIFLDEEEEPRGRSPIKLEVTPGSHVVRARLAGYAHATASAEVERAIQRALVLQLVDTRPVPAPEPESQALRWVGWGGVGAGIVLGAVGGVFSASAASAADEGRDLKGGDPRYDSLEAEADGDNATAVVMYGAGAALLVAGVTLLLWPSSAEATASESGWRF